MRMTRQHFEFIADNIGPHIKWPSEFQSIANKLAASNPKFNKEKFIQRASKACEDNHPEIYEAIDDEINF